MLNKMPFVRVLDAAMATLLEADLQTVLRDLLITMGKDGEPATLKLRWARNRYTTIEEKPCIALAFVDDEVADNQEQYAAAGETIRALGLDIVADVILPSEVEVDELGLVSDVARLEILSQFAYRAMQALRQSFVDPAGAPTPLSNLAHWVEDLGVQEDDDLADEDGRLVYRARLLYRVSSTDQTILLSTE